MELLERFKTVLKNSKISELEMSFSFECTPEAFKSILEGREHPTSVQEKIMFRFIMKELKIRTPFQAMESFYQNDEAISAQVMKDDVMISKKDVHTIIDRIEKDVIAFLKIK